MNPKLPLPETVTLALVIPVRNDAEGLAALLYQVAELGCFDQVVIGDDASDVPVGIADVPSALREQCTILRNDRPGGAGQMRNRALQAVTCSHLIFFDSDDLFTEEIGVLWRALRNRRFDFCLFRHNDSRVSARGGWGQMPLDDALWRLAGVADGARGPTGPLPGSALAYLAETSNYPWNKICRTGFLRDNGLRFSEIPVHNDIAMHWHLFSCAGTILVSNRIAAIHRVSPDGQRLTNRRSAARLRVFEPLREVAEALRHRHGSHSRLMLALWRFIAVLIPWVRGNLIAGLQGEFDRLAAAFLSRELERDAGMDWLCRADPVLALKLTLMLAQGRGQGPDREGQYGC